MRNAAFGLAAMAASLSISSYTPAHAADLSQPNAAETARTSSQGIRCSVEFVIKEVFSRKFENDENTDLSGVVVHLYAGKKPYFLFMVNPKHGWYEGVGRDMLQKTYDGLATAKIDTPSSFPCGIWDASLEGGPYMILARDVVLGSSNETSK